MRISDWSSDVCSSDLRLCGDLAWRHRLPDDFECGDVKLGIDSPTAQRAAGTDPAIRIGVRCHAARTMVDPDRDLRGLPWTDALWSGDRKSTRLNSSH